MFRKISMAALAVVFALVFTGCGTLFRGDRVGKRSSNQIDPAILVLDCCGFLFGIIPGVVALVLDINNKTIYYSASEAAMSGNCDTSRMIALKVDDMSEEGIAQALSRELGREVRFNEIHFAAAK